jgi:hypothetical protein
MAISHAAGSRGSIEAPSSHIDLRWWINQRPLPRLQNYSRVQRRKRLPKGRQRKAIWRRPSLASVCVGAGAPAAPSCRRGDASRQRAQVGGMPPVNSAGLCANVKLAARICNANVLTTPRRIASGLLQQAAGVITDFSAGDAVLGCCRRPTVRRGSRCVPRR